MLLMDLTVRVALESKRSGQEKAVQTIHTAGDQSAAKHE